ncbi:MAG: DUF134 domain-containing protein [Bacteroidales bacterium]|nr:DUF134 domain-containing protein [Bacteroidales bacterium]
MARPKKLRKVINPPPVKGFRPMGQKPGKDFTPIMLSYDEYEALRLTDYKMKNHLQAAMEMHVSRATFTRIYANARRKVATSLVEGKPIAFEGGAVYFNSDWYSCNRCSCYFNHPHKDLPEIICPLCKSSQVVAYEENTLNF